MIYHLVNNEKIIDRAIDIFESVFPNENLFIVFRQNEQSYIKKKNNHIISIKDFESQKDRPTPSSVIIHSNTGNKIKFINKHIAPSVPVYWVVWGSDLYDRFLAPKGYKIIDKNSSYYKSVKLAKTIRSIIKTPSDKIRIISRLKFIEKRVKYIVTSTIEDDYDVFSEYYPQIHSKIHKDFSYYPIDWIIDQKSSESYANGQNIQIGNSSSFTNNHEYVFRILSTLDMKDRKIIVPLSYPNRKKFKKYKDAVIHTGDQLFHDKFKAITDYMPLVDYNDLMSSCDIAIYGHWRQEAVGNVLASLYLGSKVFLSNKNPMLEWAKRHGFVVYTLETITQEDLDSPLKQADQENNRKILLNYFDSKALFECIKSTFSDRKNA